MRYRINAVTMYGRNTSLEIEAENYQEAWNIAVDKANTHFMDMVEPGQQLIVYGDLDYAHTEITGVEEIEELDDNFERMFDLMEFNDDISGQD